MAITKVEFEVCAHLFIVCDEGVYRFAVLKREWRKKPSILENNKSRTCLARDFFFAGNYLINSNSLYLGSVHISLSTISSSLSIWYLMLSKKGATSS